MPFAFNRYLDRWKHRILSYAGGTELRDHLIRSEDSYVDFKLTNAQLQIIGVSAVELVSAPGVGHMLMPTRLITKVQAGTTAFNIGAGTLDFRYGAAGTITAATSGNPLVSQLSNAQIELTASTSGYVVQTPASPYVPKLNQALVVYGSEAMSAYPTDGTGAIFGRLFYRTVKITEVGT